MSKADQEGGTTPQPNKITKFQDDLSRYTNQAIGLVSLIQSYEASDKLIETDLNNVIWLLLDMLHEIKDTQDALYKALEQRQPESKIL